ncbi:hypothetical protein Kfla_5323 [Kribbella flavida DSM 17836]|uniref:Uncharacterized protein n=1 Tax=Kribbella flavida (strain DSM 17836 / JCM 10339 / NBRC 14399) TaxID=479435 RepID=D2PL81_KRIFD|nr:hypothetical protein [Kribbella flavida]ADB34336.1 hypothetical protein Kfla_5323 [Kribbella flavida DSM 17836]
MNTMPMDPQPDPSRPGQDESVNPPHRDDDPPKRERSAYLWLALIGLAVVAFVGLFLAYAVIVAR